MLTRFLHAHLHRSRLRELVATQLAVNGLPSQPVLTVCPTCGQAYFADVGPDIDAWELELEMWEAVARLDGECPDHPYWFIVGR